MTVSTVELPPTTGRPLLSAIEVRWPRITVTARDYGPEPSRTVEWTSADGGNTWKVDG
jgi:hypothetical protein